MFTVNITEKKSNFDRELDKLAMEYIRDIKKEEQKIIQLKKMIEEKSKEGKKMEETKIITINNNYEEKENKKVLEPDEIIDNEEDNQTSQDRAEHDKYAELLNKYKYNITNESLFFKKTKELSNFIPIITKKVIYTNGADEEIKYKLRGILLDDVVELDEIEVSKNEIENFKFISGRKSNWDKYTIIRPNCEKYLKEVAQLLARYTMEEEIVFKNTGFERINGKLVYLYSGGAIGKDVEGIKAELTEGGLSQYCFTTEKFNLEDAGNTSYDILNIANEKISIPLIGYTYLTPIVSLLSGEGILCDFVLMLVGRTNTGKSSMAAIANSHFGYFTRNNFNVSLNDSLAKISRQAFILKDSMLTPDDLNPGHTTGKEKLVEDILGFFGDRQGLGRAKSNGEIRSTYYPRGTAMLTAEYIPNISPSRLSRTVILEFDDKTVNVERLTEINQKVNKQKLAFCMKNYIQWIIDNEIRLKEDIKKILKIQKMQINNSKKILGRTREIRILLFLGFYLFLSFLKENNVITKKEQEEWENKAQIELDDILEEQTDYIDIKDPIEMFYSAMRRLYEIRKITFVDYGNGKLLHFNGREVGYVDGNRLYLYWKSKTDHPIYDEVCDYYRKKGTKFPLTAPVLLKELDKRGLLEKTGDKKSKTVYKTDPLDKNKVKVINIAINHKTENEDE